MITTHYIEEARKADRVGLMRNGKLLAEESPDYLIEQFNQPVPENTHFFKYIYIWNFIIKNPLLFSLKTLEDVFLTLCINDQDKVINNGLAIPNYDVNLEKVFILSRNYQIRIGVINKQKQFSIWWYYRNQSMHLIRIPM